MALLGTSNRRALEAPAGTGTELSGTGHPAARNGRRGFGGVEGGPVVCCGVKFWLCMWFVQGGVELKGQGLGFVGLFVVL